MRKLLEQNNYDLINEVEKIEFSLKQKEKLVPSELNNFYVWLIELCKSLKTQLNENLTDISKNKENILVDISSFTNVVTRTVNTLNSLYLNPILRMSTSDRLCLKLLHWLHREHYETTDKLFAISDGSFASLPYPTQPTIYLVPPSSQERLLYLPLLFHEFGHLLYTLHKDEMNCLVKELQQKIVQILEPSVNRNDQYSQEGTNWRRIISEIWHEWTQEIFCDAVGLTIGGPAFLHSFSMHLRMRGREEFLIHRESMAKRDHPVSWLRVKILANRAKSMGLNEVASDLETSWKKIAEHLEIQEDYFGFYTQDFLMVIQQKIDDMLVEAAPRQFTQSETEFSQDSLDNLSPIKLLNMAWHQFYTDPQNYNIWETKVISQWLSR